MDYYLSQQFQKEVIGILKSGEVKPRNQLQYYRCSVEELYTKAQCINVYLNQVFFEKGKVTAKYWTEEDDNGMFVERGFPSIDFSSEGFQNNRYKASLLNQAVCILDAVDLSLDVMSGLEYQEIHRQEEQFEWGNVPKGFDEHFQTGLFHFALEAPTVKN